MRFVGEIDKNIYKCITKDIITDIVIITEKQLEHIVERHPEAYELLTLYFNDILDNPDYIIKDVRANTGLIIKRIEQENVSTQMVLRIVTKEDEEGYCNSVISCWRISENRLNNYLRNKEILYIRSGL